MDPSELIALAQRLVAGQISPSEFNEQISAGSHVVLDPELAATVDLDRRRRCGYPEVIFGPGKTVEQMCQIASTLAEHGEPVLATRINEQQAAGLVAAFPSGRHNEVARTFRFGGEPAPSSGQQGKASPKSFVAVISAGTGDLPVAEEARETLDWMGVNVTMVHDVGVAGPQRLPARIADFEHAAAIVVVAGMEGALPSVVGGYVSCPVIGVPTSIGYGANFGGVSALLSMLNSRLFGRTYREPYQSIRVASSTV
jgi:NCAIR mutase (PurE)-related protein